MSIYKLETMKFLLVWKIIKWLKYSNLLLWVFKYLFNIIF